MAPAYSHRVNRAGCVVITHPRGKCVLLQHETCEQFLAAVEKLDDQGAPPASYEQLLATYVNNGEW